MKTSLVIKRIREFLGKGTQEEIADYMGIDRRRFKNLEADAVKKFNDDEIEKIIQKIGLSKHFIVTGEEIPTDIAPIMNNNTYSIPALSVKASAGDGNHLEGIDSFDASSTINIDKMLFNGRPSENLRAIQVDGYSMAPMLMPDSWVIFELERDYEGDGLYILNWRNVLMVKQIQLDMANGQLKIISTNKDYDSYDVNPDDQSVFKIIGKVIRAII